MHSVTKVRAIITGWVSSFWLEFGAMREWQFIFQCDSIRDAIARSLAQKITITYRARVRVQNYFRGVGGAFSLYGFVGVGVCVVVA